MKDQQKYKTLCVLIQTQKYKYKDKTKQAIYTILNGIYFYIKQASFERKSGINIENLKSANFTPKI